MYCPRIVALDYGTKNVGIAACDELGVSVQPLPSIPNRSRHDLMRRLREAVGRCRADRLVVGIPLNMDGTSGESVKRVEEFIERLQSELGLPLERVDERLSTVEALELWRAMNERKRRKYRTVDSLAAALILERFLKEGGR